MVISVIGAHACDPECLAGRTALKHLREGYKVIMTSLTCNDKVRPEYSPEVSGNMGICQG